MKPQFIWFFDKAKQRTAYLEISHIAWWACMEIDNAPPEIEIGMTAGGSNMIFGEDAERIVRQLKAFTYDSVDGGSDEK